MKSSCTRTRTDLKSWLNASCDVNGKGKRGTGSPAMRSFLRCEKAARDPMLIRQNEVELSRVLVHPGRSEAGGQIVIKDG